MKHNEYWKRREEEALNHYITDEAEYDRQIQQIYQDMLDSCNEQINAFYGKYADKEGITLAEAKKRVSQLDIAAYERKAKRYVKDKDFSAQANEEMRLYNATMQINRFEMLKANIGLELIKGHDELEKFMGGILKGRAEEELKRQAGILGKTITNNAKAAHAIVNASYKNATFSDRVWMYHDEMKADLSKMLKTGLIQGKNPKALARELEKYVMGDAKGGAKFNAERLMRTELARVQTEAQKQSFERNGFEKYIFIVNSGCCSLCEDAKNKDIGYGKGVYLVKDMMPGENAAPIHPFCRCSVAAYSDRKEYDEWLNYLEQGGTTAEWEKTKAIRKATESGSYQTSLNRIGTNDVDMQYIESAEFRNKFSRITNNTAVNDALRKYAVAMLTHRKGTDGEDLYIIDAATGGLLLRKIAGNDNLGVTVTAEEVEELRSKHYGKTIGLHNHPTNLPPTGSDYGAAGYRGYKFGLVITHSGKVYKYESGAKPFLPELFDKRVDKYCQTPYNMGVDEAHKKVLNEFESEYGVLWAEIK